MDEQVEAVGVLTDTAGRKPQKLWSSPRIAELNMFCFNSHCLVFLCHSLGFVYRIS